MIIITEHYMLNAYISNVILLKHGIQCKATESVKSPVRNVKLYAPEISYESLVESVIEEYKLEFNISEVSTGNVYHLIFL